MFDLLIRNVRVVQPHLDTTTDADIAITDGKVAAIQPGIDAAEATEVVDGGGKLAFPGVVDAHQHWGIYNPLPEDAVSESRASAQGGVTTGITYMRTGQYYLYKGGPYREFFPEVLRQAEGNAHVDYAFHLAPMMKEHIDELGMLVDDFGVASFKIFMFYGSHGLHGRSSDQSQFLMTPPDERYDYAHFEFIMRGLQKVREERPELADRLSLSLHCETAEIMAAYTKMVEEAGTSTGLKAYHESRPPHSEGLAITIASYLAHETQLANINLLHLSSAKAMEAAMTMARAFPHIDFRREVTVGHLLTDIDSTTIGAKVNPPIRPREDVEALWQHLLDGDVDWVVSDHACCKDEMKFGADRDDVFLAKSGFGGTEYLLPGLFSEGTKRGMTPEAVAKLTSWNPSRRYGLGTKGTLEVGYDADVALVDPDRTWTVHAEDSESTQEYTPFEGIELTAAVTDVYLRGSQIVRDGKVIGEPTGHYISRPSEVPRMTTPLTSTAYTAEVTADAGRDGSVRSPDGVLDLPLGRPPGMGGKEGDGRTNPEQLFAAGYAACFHSALLFIARQEKITVTGSTVTAKVSIGAVEAGGFGLAVTLEVDLPDVADDDAKSLMAKAHMACPYSRATRGNIDVEVIRAA